MKDLNVLSLIGRLTKDAEIKYTQNGLGVASFSIAVNYDKKTQSGYEKDVSFFDCVYFAKNADAVSKYLVKGKQVAIAGEIRQERWQDKQSGGNRSAVRIYVSSLILLGGEQSDGQPTTSQRQTAFKPRPQQQVAQHEQYNDGFQEDLPF